MASLVSRAGRFEQQLTGYRAFIPAPLPPDPPVSRDAEMDTLLSQADLALGRLDGCASILPNPDAWTGALEKLGQPTPLTPRT